MANNSERDLEVFMEAIELSHEDQVAFLDRIGTEDASLRLKVEALLRSHERVGDFLETPPTAAINEVKGIISGAEKAGDRVDKYKLLQKIGEGGCGIVFLAEQERPVHRRVALKIIKPGMDTKSVIARFEAERQALAMMDHPNIAKIFDAGTTESGRPYFVMELVLGLKITEYADRHSLTTEDRVKLFGQVCEAVPRASKRNHSQGYQTFQHSCYNQRRRQARP
jgi:serine/threonine protein kinase